jgi:hypothetical protein
LGNVELQDDIQVHEYLKLAIGEEAFTLGFQPKRRCFQLVVGDVNRL